MEHPMIKLINNDEARLYLCDEIEWLIKEFVDFNFLEDQDVQRVNQLIDFCANYLGED